MNGFCFLHFPAFIERSTTAVRLQYDQRVLPPYRVSIAALVGCGHQTADVHLHHLEAEHRNEAEEPNEPHPVKGATETGLDRKPEVHKVPLDLRCGRSFSGFTNTGGGLRGLLDDVTLHVVQDKPYVVDERG